jgi:hypothetical protein
MPTALDGEWHTMSQPFCTMNCSSMERSWSVPFTPLDIQHNALITPITGRVVISTPITGRDLDGTLALGRWAWLTRLSTALAPRAGKVVARVRAEEVVSRPRIWTTRITAVDCVFSGVRYTVNPQNKTWATNDVESNCDAAIRLHEVACVARQVTHGLSIGSRSWPAKPPLVSGCMLKVHAFSGMEPSLLPSSVTPSIQTSLQASTVVPERKQSLQCGRLLCQTSLQWHE